MSSRQVTLPLETGSTGLAWAPQADTTTVWFQSQQVWSLLVCVLLTRHSAVCTSRICWWYTHHRICYSPYSRSDQEAQCWVCSQIPWQAWIFSGIRTLVSTKWHSHFNSDQVHKRSPSQGIHDNLQWYWHTNGTNHQTQQIWLWYTVWSSSV